MTDEEIEKQAEEYAEKNKPSDALCSMGEIIGNAREYDGLKQGFIAGAKWGMEHATEWHDLRKDPNDLPTENGEYCCFVYEHGYEIHRFNTFKNCFLGVFSRVIKWCKLETYKE